MAYLNIETETDNYSIEFPYNFSNNCAIDMWYAIEDVLPSFITDELVDYRKSKKASGQLIKIDFQPVVNDLRRAVTLRRPRKAGEWK